jgi:hypothetical protein
MRLLGRGVLLGMARAHRYAREVQPRHQFTHRAFVQLHTETSGNLVAQVHQAPAYHLVLFQRRTLPDPLGDRRFLFDCQLARRRT